MRSFPLAALLLSAAFPAVAEDAPIPPLSDAQLAVVKAFALAELEALHADEGMIYAIEEQNGMHARMTPRKIKALDRRWQAGDSHSLIATELMGRQESYFLHERREKSDGIVTEFIVMDRFGLNVAISDYTPDYWQGDEPMFQQTFPNGAGALHVSAPNRDDAAHRVQVEVSVTITSPSTGQPIGALTVGIDVEHALEKAGKGLIGEAEGAAKPDPA